MQWEAAELHSYIASICTPHTTITQTMLAVCQRLHTDTSIIQQIVWHVYIYIYIQGLDHTSNSIPIIQQECSNIATKVRNYVK